MSYAVLQAMGWQPRRLLGLLSVEQAAFITPALFVGVLLGLLVAALMLPFLALTGQQVLQIPFAQVGIGRGLQSVDRTHGIPPATVRSGISTQNSVEKQENAWHLFNARI